jgi:hypothetical protein
LMLRGLFLKEYRTIAIAVYSSWKNATIKMRVADPHHLDADPDRNPDFYLNVDSDQFWTLTRIRIQIQFLFKVMGWAFRPPLWASTTLHGTILIL